MIAGGASEIQSAFSVENRNPGFLQENTTCVGQFNNSAFVPREQNHTM